MNIEKIDENRESGTWPPTTEEKRDMRKTETHGFRAATTTMLIGLIVGAVLLVMAQIFRSSELAIAGGVAVFVAICALGCLGSQGPV